MGASYIDPDTLPFTVAEIEEAFRLGGMADGDAADVAARIAALPALAATGAADAEAARARGSTDPLEISPPGWFVSDELYAALWALPGCRERVDSWMARRWSRWERSWIKGEALRRGIQDADAPPPDVVRLVRRRLAPFKGAWTRKKNRIRDYLGLPDSHASNSQSPAQAKAARVSSAGERARAV